MSLNKPKANITETKTTEETTTEKVAEVAQETVVAEQAPAVSTTTEVATTSQNTTAMAASPQGGSMVEALAAEGFEGLQEGFHSYMTIKLPADGIFCTQEDEEIGKQFKAYLLGSKAKYLYSNADDDKDDEHVVYSYDRVTTTTGENLDDILDEWKAEGIVISEKKYLDLTVEVADGEFEGELAMCSVSPASVQKLTGYMGKLRRKQINPRETATEIYAAAKVKTKGGNSFYPWGFKLAD